MTSDISTNLLVRLEGVSQVSYSKPWYSYHKLDQNYYNFDQFGVRHIKDWSIYRQKFLILPFLTPPGLLEKAGQTFKIGIYNFIIDGACFLWERKLNEGIEYFLEKKWLKPK